MQDIPFFHSYDHTSKRLTIRGATHFPLEILRYADAIEILDMSHGELTSLPPEFAQLHQLKIAFFSHNPFTELPAILAKCVNLDVLGFKSCRLNHIAEDALPTGLRWLILTDNNLKTLPTSIGKLTQLKKLALAGNQLQTLPVELAQCQNLELIRLGANQLEAVPAWLPQLPQLAWYGDAGNPYSQPAAMTTVKEIAWSDLELGELLGESPSSRVYQAIHRPTQQVVAVKIYHSKMTSDGYIQDDLKANLATGEHPHLISVLGQLVNTSDQQTGLVLKLVPPEYHNLGLPPSLVSCTRDTYPTNTKFDSTLISQVVEGITAAMMHLHTRGIMHGDLYAHNILVNAAGHALLGDFGAASLYDPSVEPWRETVELRALQHLAVELTNRCRDTISE